MLTSVEYKKLHVFAMCETKLNQHKLSSAFHIDGFHQPLRRDNLKSGGGGIIIYVRNDIIAIRRTNLEINYIDCLWIKISPRKGKSSLVGRFYRNPNEKSEFLIENVLLENKEIIMGILIRICLI